MRRNRGWGGGTGNHMIDVRPIEIDWPEPEPEIVPCGECGGDCIRYNNGVIESTDLADPARVDAGAPDEICQECGREI